MRSSRVLTLVAGVAWLAACGSDGNGPSNNAPTADFTSSCNDLVCTFTDASSDGDGSVASVVWDFGDGSATVSGGPLSSTTHTFASANTYNVKVTAKDNDNATGSKTTAVTVTAPAPGGPTADFDVTCGGLTCNFTNNSTATGSVVTWAWDFGNSTTSTDQDPAPVTYAVTDPTTFTITLTVTSDGATSTATKQVRVSPGASLTCNGADCTLGIDQRATVVVTVTSSDCQVHGNTFVITAPAVDTLFTDGCFAPVDPAPGSSFSLNGGNAYDAGTQLAAEVLTGVTGATNAQLRVTGTFADGWTLEFDDGFVGPGEPDFNDIVITVKATPAP
jgi:PKD repeat protein